MKIPIWMPKKYFSLIPRHRTLYPSSKKNMHKRFDIVLVDLSPTKGHEQQGMRPCIILQNDFISQYLGVYLVAPITKNLLEVPTGLVLNDWQSYGLDAPSKILFHQIRVIDETRIVKLLGKV